MDELDVSLKGLLLTEDYDKFMQRRMRGDLEEVKHRKWHIDGYQSGRVYTWNMFRATQFQRVAHIHDGDVSDSNDPEAPWGHQETV